jgi:hypothetical protein
MTSIAAGPLLLGMNIVLTDMTVEVKFLLEMGLMELLERRMKTYGTTLKVGSILIVLWL